MLNIFKTMFVGFKFISACSWLASIPIAFLYSLDFSGPFDYLVLAYGLLNLSFVMGQFLNKYK